MPSLNDLIRRMIVAHESGDRSAFRDAVRELVAEEKRKNHHLYARDLERILFNGIASNDEFQGNQSPSFRQLESPKDEDRGLLLLEIKEPKRHLDELVLDSDTREPIRRMLNEAKHSELLESYGLKSCKKILFFGPPGCGKTVAAECIATELYMPFVLVRFDGIVSSYLGETSANLRRVFEFLRMTPCVALFDEFDAIGKKRTNAEEHGELKRAVNSFLQILDSFVSDSIIIAATNHEHLLDSAIWRRFDDVVQFPLPSVGEREALLHVILRHATNVPPGELKKGARMMDGFAHADVERVAIDALKASILSTERMLSPEVFFDSLERQRKRLDTVAGNAISISKPSIKRPSTTKPAKGIRSSRRKD